MKKLLTILLSICMLVNIICLPATTSADVYEDVWEYTISGTEATITKYSGTETTVTVPSTVSDGINTYTVTAVGNGSGNINGNLVNVTLPSTIKRINAAAFYAMKKSGFTINFPEGLEEIGSAAFYDSGQKESLVNIVFPSTLKKIGARAFYQCTRIKSITFKSETAPTIAVNGSKEAFWNLTGKPVIYYPENGVGYDDVAFRNMFASTNATPVEGKNALVFAYTGTSATAAPTATATPKPTLDPNATPTPKPTPTATPSPTPVPTPTPEPDWAENINLFINEVSSSNVTTIKDGFGNNADWIEIYNASDGAVRLDGYGLSDSADEPYKYVLPNIVIPKEKYLLIFTSENVPEGATGAYANFDIPKTGGIIILTNPTGNLSDSVTVPALDDDQSYGRVTDGGKDFEILIPSPGKTNEGDEFDVLRRKWVEQITGGDDIDVNDPLIAAQIQLITTNANADWTTLEKSETRTYLWSSQNIGSRSAYITGSYNKIYNMALGYVTVGSPLYKNEELLSDIISSMEWMSDNAYNSSKTMYDNWWDWNIGAPRHIVNIIALLYDEIPQELKDEYYETLLTFVPDSIYKSWTGANKVWLTGIGMVHGVLAKDAARINTATNAIGSVFKYSTKGDGFYTDGSFIQHTYHPYTGGYGLSLLTDVSKIMAWLGGSEFDIPTPDKNNVFKWVYDSFEPLMYKGNLMDMVAGREISRANVSGYTRGKTLINALVLLAQIAPEEDRENYINMINSWIKGNTYTDYFEGNSIYFVVKAKELLTDDEYIEEKSMVKIFPAMDRVIMKRPDFAIGIAMHSKDKTQAFEFINSENSRGWYTASGTVYLYNGDMGAYDGGFWPTVNNYNHAGVSSNTSKTIDPKKGTTSYFAGGVALDDMYGAVGFRFTPSAYSHDSKKSYFLFDDEVVLVGNVTADASARTTLENRKVTDSYKFVIDNVETNTTKGSTVTTTNPKWAHLDGNAENSDIGYYFPKDTTIKSLRESRTAKWTSINKYPTYNSYTDDITNSFLSMWVDHGATPSNDPYAYVLLPNKSVAETESYSKNPDIVIDTQTEKVHAVKETKLGITAANFFEAEVAQSTDFRCDNMASVIMQQNGTELSVSLSDPTMKTTGNITLEIARSGLAATKLDSNVKVVSLTPTIKVEIDVTNKKGLGSDMKFTLSSPDYVELSKIQGEEPFVNIADSTVTRDVSTNTLSGNVSLVVENLPDNESVTVLLAIYNSDDVLVKTKIGTVDSTNNRADFENISVSAIKDDNYKIKAYAWHDFGSCMPMAVSVDVK